MFRRRKRMTGSRRQPGPGALAGCLLLVALTGLAAGACRTNAADRSHAPPRAITAGAQAQKSPSGRTPDRRPPPAHGEVSRVSCPPVQIDHRSRSNHPGESALPVSLVVLGRVSPVKPTGDQKYSDLYTVAVEEVIFGNTGGKILRFEAPHATRGRRVLAFTDNPYGAPEPYLLRYHQPASEAAAARILARARLDFYSLRATDIVVGRETAVLGDYVHEVRVDRTLRGDVKPGARLKVQSAGYIRHSGKKPVLRARPMAYLLVAGKGGKAKEQGPSHGLLVRFPATMAGDIRAALKRRTRHPVVPVGSGKEQGHAVEVMFQGSDAEAVALLSSRSRAVRALVARRLLWRDARAPVLAEVRRQLLKPGPVGAGQFMQLQSLIPLLGELERRRRTGALERLLDRVLKHVAAGGAPPEAGTKQRTYHEPAHRHDHVNHALTWLCQALDREHLIQRHGRRLLRLQATAGKGWREELDLAILTCRVRDTLELRAAIKRSAGLRRVRSSPPPLRHGGDDGIEGLAFSPDGKLLATGAGDLRIWRTADWSLARRIDTPFADLLRFSSDSKKLYAAGGYKVHALARYDVKTGRKEVEYLGHEYEPSFFALTRGGESLISAGYLDELVCVFDAATGQRRRRAKMAPEECYHLAFNPAKAHLARHLDRDKSKGGISIEDLKGKRLRLVPSTKHEANHLAYTPDGRHLVSTSFNWEGIWLQVNAVESAYRKVAARHLQGDRCTALAISPDSKLAMTGDQDGKLHLVSLPGLTPVKSLDLNRGGVVKGIETIAFAPDGKRVAVAQNGRATPHLLSLPRLEPVVVAGVGHGDRVTTVRFDGQGRPITIGRDRVVIRWETDPPRPGRRTRFPAGLRLADISPGGRYALLHGRKSENDHYDAELKTRTPMAVVDLVSGKVVSRRLRLPYSGNTPLLWPAEDEIVLLVQKKLLRYRLPDGRALGRVSIKRDPKVPSYLQLLGLEMVPGAAAAFAIEGGARSSYFGLYRLTLRTGEVHKVGERPLDHFTGNRRGLVPGGKLLYMAAPGYFVFDPATLEPVASSMVGQELLSTSFSRDGRTVAVVTGVRNRVDGNLRIWESTVKSVVRVLDAGSGKTRFALPSPTRWSRVHLSPDGRRLALVNDDGTLELVDLPAVPLP